MANNTNGPADNKRPIDDHTSSCTHSDGRDLPVCWDCAEEGHVKQKFDALPSSPTWENFKRITKGLRLPQQQHQHHHRKIPLSSAAPEVHPPEEGIEVLFHGQHQQQPGLEVVAGPRVVNPEDKFRRVIPVVVAASIDEKKKEAVAGEGGGEARISDSSRDREGGEGGEKKKEEEEEAGRRIYGLRRRTFWAVVACALLVLVAVVLGVAVGVTQRNRAMQSTALSVSSNADQGVSSHPSSSSSSSLSALVTTETMYMTASDGGSGGENTAISPSPSTTPTPTTTAAAADNTNTNTLSPSPSPSPSPSSSSTTTSPSPSCLGADGSTYTDAATRSRFRVECDVAHQGKDIVNREAASMEACVALCARDDACRGAIWYDAGPQGTDLNYCWLKSAMSDERRETRDAQSVVRL
ncbi:hypothetical protein F5X96DRAFT_684745 [Biscogniauxia mediterranea]|nr:hypothetical protein F5X96DRAFT_684745 [Biscogniauxia mediterranea]